ncbi:hypothetical protein Marshall_112 [Salmonella phage Marshall]|uniref:Uncharacterized protein n=2 Tax=Kuttervirus TaxID=2169536 RepID=U5PUR0_9CAUD|nr:hypothetical protein Marshall_112 [Salmonella phage Marshall]YP_009880188.1 hypothetical protein HYP60_gp049 [Escherichia phage EP75]EGJ6623282.1 hypothetical protein [Salmonella enterica]QKE54739.1 hypothetical protein AC4HA11_0860 [Escherichia phage vB_EcoA_4HA11]AGY47629.1 hypothetical protein Marshall_112 [Salmonella phage Marshall]AVZ44923.1 hypothetical protein [Escherichia phage EP75]ELN9277131.1 hypothetical protein [Salmonella enterica]
MKIILDAYIRYGSKWLMAKVYDGEELVHAQTAPSEQLREIMKRDFPTVEMIEPANQTEVDKEWEREWSPAALAQFDKNYNNRQNASRPFRR